MLEHIVKIKGAPREKRYNLKDIAPLEMEEDA